jgi:hypothetical protein
VPVFHATRGRPPTSNVPTLYPGRGFDSSISRTIQLAPGEARRRSIIGSSSV